ncbi:hypothetical protein C8N32_10224 [Rhodovulum imhoffii]|uniref:Gamma-glutamyl kinase n=1 Tax=Rhodovulum imhoffii TaxID=365340 RepID=A0A2T5BV93_9RHOB|nr:gamma-glutamyl kinase [Rhodovulum imhoffii]MBK5934250.1 hypothetical protein [Rhodovulum imhoffii]PTN03503.1 hypothetical protein C8N32_10224 [Rhodovulum imhoffii]
MMLFWKAGLAFLAVPKTGTHAYQELLGPGADIIFRHPQSAKHMNINMFRRRILPLIDGGPRPIETLAVIREPQDWLGSWYRYRQRPQLKGKPASTLGLSFAEFIDAYLKESPPEFARVGQQSRMVSTPEGVIAVDRLFRHDDQSGLCRFLSERLGQNVPIPPLLNVSPSGDLALPGDLARRLRKARAQDFALYEQVSQAAH